MKSKRLLVSEREIVSDSDFIKTAQGENHFVRESSARALIGNYPKVYRIESRPIGVIEALRRWIMG